MTPEVVVNSGIAEPLMTGPASTPACLPLELWECVLLQLTPWEALKLRRLNRRFRDLIDGSPMTQYRIQMFEEAVEEGVGQDWPPMNLTDRRSQLRKYRSRWNHFDRATQETFIIPPAKFRIYQKGYFAYIFRNGSKTTLCARIIRLPSTCNGVTRGEWVFSLEMLPPNVIVQGMTLQPELDLLVVMVSSDQRMLLDTHMLRLSDGQPHPALPTPETVRAGPGFGIVAAYPCVTRSRLAVLIVNLRPDDWGADMLRGYDLCTGRVVLDELGDISHIHFIDDFWLLVQSVGPAGAFTLWDTTNPTTPNARFLQDPTPPYPGSLDRECFEMTTSAGATGVFSTDSSQRVLAISGFMATEGFRKRQGFTFVIRSSALISLALEEGRGAAIEWQKWKEKVTVFDRSCRSIVHVEGSRVFTLERPLGGEANFVVYDFSPGSRKERGNPPYTSQHLRLADTPPIPQTHCWFEISGNTLVLLDSYLPFGGITAVTFSV